MKYIIIKYIGSYFEFSFRQKAQKNEKVNERKKEEEKTWSTWKVAYAL